MAASPGPAVALELLQAQGLFSDFHTDRQGRAHEQALWGWRVERERQRSRGKWRGAEACCLATMETI